MIMIGSHLIHHWSTTQATVALSSAEAELNALVKGCSESLGLKNLAEEWGQELKVRVNIDSSAANGIAHREGCGKVKHLETRQLWVQETVARKSIDVKKIPRALNCADAVTHYWTNKEGEGHFARAGLRWV